MSFFHAASTASLLLVAAGLVSRRRRLLHVRLMLTAFAIDVALLLFIEIRRGAVEKVITAGRALLTFHVAVSVLMLAGYVVQLTLGMRILRGSEGHRRMHALCGACFCVFRLLNYVTSFLVVAR